MPEIKKQYFPQSVMHLGHWQNQETNRSGYLRGLALDCFLHPESDRNSHYFARELMYTGRYRSAIREFERHIAMKKWPAEAAKSQILIGECYGRLGDAAKEAEAYHKGFAMFPHRRDALLRLAEHYAYKGNLRASIGMAKAALEIPKSGFYADSEADHTYLPHEIIYKNLLGLGDRAGARPHWEKCVEYLPEEKRFIQDSALFI